MKRIFELLAAGALGAIIATVTLNYVGEKQVEPRCNWAEELRRELASSPHEATAAPTPAVNPEWPGASFPSNAWRGNELEWYIQWKRVHKYARIAFETSQSAGFTPLLQQARDLWENVAGWQDGRPRSACLPAAEQLHKSITALDNGEFGGISALRTSETAGDKCRAATQAALRRR